MADGPREDIDMPQLPPDMVELIDDLIDNRFDYADMFRPISRQTIISRGTGGTLYSVPEPLQPYIQPWETNVEVSQKYTISEHQLVTLGWFGLRLRDVEPNPGFLLSPNEADQIDYFSGAAYHIAVDQSGLERAYRSLVPAMPDQARQIDPSAVVTRLAPLLFQSSTTSHQHMEARVSTGIFCFDDIELRTNSIHDVVIIHRGQHPPDPNEPIDRTLETRLTIRERAVKKQDRHTDANLDLRAGQLEVFFEEELVDGKQVRVHRPTKLHLDAIREAIESILDKTIAI